MCLRETLSVTELENKTDDWEGRNETQNTKAEKNGIKRGEISGKGIRSAVISAKQTQATSRERRKVSCELLLADVSLIEAQFTCV